MSTRSGQSSTEVEETKHQSLSKSVDDHEQRKRKIHINNNGKSLPKKKDRSDKSSSNLHLEIKQNRYFALATFTGLTAIFITLFWLEIYSANWYKELIEGTFWNEIQYSLRCILFPLCFVSYFDTYSYTDHDQANIFEMILHPLSNTIKVFLDLSFTLFWPTGENTHKKLMIIIVTLSIVCQSILNLCVRINKINDSFSDKKWSDLFYVVKILRDIIKFHTLTTAIFLVKHFFTFDQDYNIANPWDKYRRQYSNSKSVSMQFKIIITFLFVSLLSESYFIEYNDKINAENSMYDVLFAFICLQWRDIFIPLFMYPYQLLVLFIILFFCFGNYGRNILKGLLTYLIIITSQRTILTILSLIVVWEINTFDKDFEKFIDDVFTTMNMHKIKDRFDDFETKNQSMKLIKKKLHFMIHFIIIERVTSMLLDFWNFYCDEKKNWNTYVFLSRHLFYLILIGWVLRCIALFNRKYPNYIIRKLHFIRLKHHCVDSNSTGCGGVFNDKEFELWLNYLQQTNFNNEFAFQLFGGINIDLKWFAGGTMLQLLFMVYSKVNIKSNQETIQNVRYYLQC